MQQPQTDDQVPQQPVIEESSPKKPRKWLTAAFNMASGAAVSLALKTTIVACTSTMLAPAVSIGIAAVAAGVASSYVRHYFENRSLIKSGQEPVKFTFKKAALGGAFGLLGAGVAAFGAEALTRFAPDFISDLKSFFGMAPAVDCPDQTPAPAVTVAAAPVIIEPVLPEAAPVVPPVAAVDPLALVEEAPAVEPCPPSPVDCVEEMVRASGGASEEIEEALKRATSTNPRIAAQGTKDLAYYLMNGLEGMPKDPCLAAKLLKVAADCGNIQAQVDLAYLEFHGNEAAGITANPAEALEKMRALDTDKARLFVAQWTGEVPAVEAPAPVAAIETVTPPPVEPVAAVDLTSSQATGATIQSGPGMDCTAMIKSDSGDIDFVCTLPVEDKNFAVGDKVIIQRPALLQLIH